MSRASKGAQYEREAAIDEIEPVHIDCLRHADAIVSAANERYMGGAIEDLGIELKRIALELDTLSVKLRGGKR